MLPGNSVILMLAASQMVNFQPHNSNGLNIVSGLQSSVKEIILKTSALNIAGNLGNCDMIRQAFAEVGYNLSSSLIDQLGGGGHIFLTRASLESVHSKFLSYTNGRVDSQNLVPGTREGEFWVTVNRSNSSLPHASSFVAQKSIKDTISSSKNRGSEAADLMARSGGDSVIFSYNFGNRTCNVEVSLSSAPIIHY